MNLNRTYRDFPIQKILKEGNKTLINSLDLIFGVYNLVLCAVAFYGYATGMASLRSFFAMLCFLLMNIAFSRLSKQSSHPIQLETLRVICGAVVSPFVYILSDYPPGHWWPVFVIMCWGGTIQFSLFSQKPVAGRVLVAFYVILYAVALSFQSTGFMLFEFLINGGVMAMGGLLFAELVAPFSLAFLAEQRGKETAENLLADIRSDLNAAKRIQSALMPATSIEFVHARARVWLKPMQEIGGDFYKCAELPDGRIRIFFGDAMGHGVQAALMTMAICTEYEALFDRVEAPAALISRLNAQFYEKYKDLNTYATCILIDIYPGEGRLTFASAGHPAQYQIHQGMILELDSTGPAIGIVRNAEYSEHTREFQAGRDSLLLYTDGFVESNNSEGEMFGDRRFTDVIQKLIDLEPEKIAEECLSEFNNFIGTVEPQDDVMLMTLTSKGVARLS